MSNQSQSPEAVFLEEDWSALVKDSTTGFAQHEQKAVCIGQNHTLDLECVSDLSPLDMLNLCNGHHDATGHRVWMGAYLFIEAIARHALSEVKYFSNKRVLELGCGTGVSGIALLLKGWPLWVTLTDSDHDTLELCQRNCDRNLHIEQTEDKGACQGYNVCQLTWGESLRHGSVEEVSHLNVKEEKQTIEKEQTVACVLQNYDTVIATDVLYDIDTLSPLLKTASEVLCPGGYFVMSYIPRASLPGIAYVATDEELEMYITQEAKSHQLVESSKIKPSDMPGTPNGLNNVMISEMEDAGAAILIYQKLEIS